jgi:hypothetical protein
MFRLRFGHFGLLAALAFASPSNATVVFNGSGSGLSAQASFTIVGSTLEILLTNTDAATGAGAPKDPASVLSGLFFNIGAVTLTPVSATIQPGGSIIQGSNCYVPSDCSTGDVNVGGEWSYSPLDASWLPGATQQGISSSGYLPSNTSSGNFGGPDLESPTALNGIEFGIVPDGWVPWSGNGGLDSNALIEGTVKFVLSIPTGVTVTEAMIRDVYFTYGTSAGEGTIPGTTTGSGTTTGGPTTGGVPEPALLSMLGLALVGVWHRARRSSGR